jgi:purine-binding chemotaxis protein CheW
VTASINHSPRSPVATESLSGDNAQIVTFRVGDDLFAADVRTVERVLRYSAPTPVPNVPSWVVGVLEYQKRVLPVIDLRVRFALAAADPTRETRILVINTAGGWVAAVVDAVLDVTSVERARIEPSPPLFRGFAADYLRGIVRREEQLVLLLAAERILTATDQTLLARMAEEPVVVAARRRRG